MKKVKHIRLIHWNEPEAKEKITTLQNAGYKVTYKVLKSNADIREIKDNPPDVILIDLTRLPSQGRDIAIGLRRYKSLSHVPLVFVEGYPEKVDRIKKNLPDAFYSSWSKIISSLKYAITNPPKDPVIPKSGFEGYSGTPLVKKLGITDNIKVLILNAPDDFEQKLGKLPKGVSIQRNISLKNINLIIWFVHSKSELDQNLRKIISKMSEKTNLWISWQKKSSAVTSDLTQTSVRKSGLKAGLVDYKICSIDKTWSGLLFTKR